MNEKTLYVSDLVKRLDSDNALLEKVRDDPKNTLANLAGATPLQTDSWVYRIVVLALGSAVLIALIGGIIIAMAPGDKKLPDLLTAIGAAAVGALAGLLAPPPTSPTP